jgi:hypothetical protein
MSFRRRLGQLANRVRVRTADILDLAVTDDKVADDTLTKAKFDQESAGGPPHLVEQVVQASMPDLSGAAWSAGPGTGGGFTESSVTLWTESGFLDLSGRATGTSHGILILYWTAASTLNQSARSAVIRFNQGGVVNRTEVRKLHLDVQIGAVSIDHFVTQDHNDAKYGDLDGVNNSDHFFDIGGHTQSAGPTAYTDGGWNGGPWILYFSGIANGAARDLVVDLYAERTASHVGGTWSVDAQALNATYIDLGQE